MLLPAGARVDRYQVLDLLGSGGMGEVYCARDPKLQRHVALKIVRLGADAAEGAKRLLREARVVATLSHPNVLAVYDVGEVSEPEALRGLTYIAMELVVGSSLRPAVGAGDVPMPRRIAWLADVARALDAAHMLGIVHRDVKPENVMIRSDGMVKVLDFGIAHRTVAAVAPPASSDGQTLPTIRSYEAAPDATRSGLAGTLLYMAPEQLRNEAIDGRVDQFAWGVMAYELLTGAHPWQRDPNPLGVVSQILSSEPVPPAQIDPNVPSFVSDVVMRALAKSAAQRFSSMAEVLAALERGAVSAGVAESASPASRPETTAAHTQPLRVAIWAGRAAVLAAFGVVTFVAVRASRAPKPAPLLPTLAERTAPASEGVCTSNAQCSRDHGGSAWRCQSTRHACAPIESPDCKVLAEPSDLTNDETIWLGALYPTTGTYGERFAREVNAVDLARRDFATALGGSGTIAGSLHARPIAVALCDEVVDPMRAAKHLVDDVEVPAMLGFRSAKTARPIIQGVLLPSHVLSIITMSWVSDLTKIPEPPGEPRLVWRTTLNTAASSPALAALLSDVIEPRVRAEPRALHQGVVRVAQLRTSNVPSEASEIYLRTLRFNGKSVLENGDDFREYVYDAQNEGSAASTLKAMAEFAPNVVFLEARGAISPLEEKWGARPRPYYLVDGNLTYGDEILTAVAKHPSLRGRIFGLTNTTERLPNAALVLHYNETFPKSTPVNRTEAPEPSYDAFYSLAYAAYALGEEPVTGTSLSRMLTTLVAPGKPIDVGPLRIFDAFTTLRSGGRIDLNGALGSLDLDPATGEAPIDFAVLCLTPDGSGGLREIESGLVYEAASKAMTGTMRCP